MSELFRDPGSYFPPWYCRLYVAIRYQDVIVPSGRAENEILIIRYLARCTHNNR